MDKIKLLIKYIVYIARRKGARGHGIHSPFIFEFNKSVLNSREKFDRYNDLLNYRRNLKSMKERIEVTDHGAGSMVFSSLSRRIADIAIHAGSSYKTGKFLYRLARNKDQGVIVELGTSLGFGTYCLARGAANGKVYTLEACPVQQGVAAAELGKAGVRNVELISGLFAESLPPLLSKLEKVDLVYFDGDHRQESLLWQFRQCLPKAGPDTVFVFGDINWSPGMNEAWNTIVSHPAVSISVDLFDCGLVFFRKGIVKQHFFLRYSSK